MHDPTVFLTKTRWRDLVAYKVNELHNVIKNGNKHVPLWWTEREIRIFWDANISQKTAEVVQNTIVRRLHEIGLYQFEVNLFGVHPTTTKQIEKSLTGGCIDEEVLSTILLNEKWRRKPFGEQHADVIITSQQFFDDSESWGAARFSHGSMVFTLYGNRSQNTDFLKNVVLHETSHLLGLCYHCDDWLNVGDYNYNPRCNMHYACATPKTCKKCNDFILAWWRELERRFPNFSNRRRER